MTLHQFISLTNNEQLLFLCTLLPVQTLLSGNRILRRFQVGELDIRQTINAETFSTTLIEVSDDTCCE